MEKEDGRVEPERKISVAPKDNLHNYSAIVFLLRFGFGMRKLVVKGPQSPIPLWASFKVSSHLAAVSELIVDKLRGIVV